MLDELDDVYVRAKSLWTQNPESLEREQPLLARAFSEQQPSEDLTLSLRTLAKQVEELRETLLKQELEAQEMRAGHEQRLRVLLRDFQAERRTARRLAELNAELDAELAKSESAATYDGD